ncbi:hypothetical protein A6B44_08235 [Pasteurella skyensis]|uniref:MarR family transcriptional regulator, negative regulator of the multidrug operon emrRAB n=1 Tax=Phocoenobacter skyensis TaxID=97481 RepID=A0A1H7UYY5_9PAST|nr:hypothetical protein A6B44_08235 [Pasteurella skyensis]SEM02161.1 MarR family transcriptional regulator, negative regulator of the multidrug operon emrRAB [Pasteurella skyensis]
MTNRIYILNNKFDKQLQNMRTMINESNKYAPVDEIVLSRLMLHTNQLFLDNRNRLLKEFGLNHTQFLALVIIYYQPNQEIQPSKLSAILGSSRTNITRISDELEKKDWLFRQLIKEDRRAFSLKLTELGNQFMADFLPNQWKLISETFSILNEQERSDLMKILQKLAMHIENQAKE